MKIVTEETKWERNSSSIFERFAAEFEESTSGRGEMESGDQDVQLTFELQRERLASKGLRIENELTPRGFQSDEKHPLLQWGDERYVNQMEYRSCQLDRHVFRDNREIKRTSSKEILYETITYARNEQSVADELYVCPNCGAVCKVSQLQKGCPYCGTFFQMRDLFPKITNFCFVKEIGRSEKEAKQEMLRYMIPSGLVYLIYGLVTTLTSGKNLLSAILLSVFGSVVAGIIFGYVLWAVIKFVGLFAQAGKTIGVLSNISGSSQRFVSLMREYSPEFSYEYFTNKVVSLLKMVIYSRQPQELPNYIGGSLGNRFTDVVDASYYGTMAVKDCQVKGDYVWITTEVYMENLYEREGSVSEKSEKIQVVLCRNLKRTIDYNFSPRKIQCRTCGASFDATKMRTCPHCQTRYEVEDDDWVIQSIR